MKIRNKYYIITILVFTTILNSAGQKREQSDPSIKRMNVVNLPFGDTLLVTHQFPRVWEFSENHKTKNQKTFEKINDYYIRLKTVKSIASPIIKQANRIAIDTDRSLNFYDQHFKGVFKYQLPNFGPYQVYYRYVEIPLPFYYQLEDSATTQQELFTYYGDLVFYDARTKHASILNIYQSYTYRDAVVAIGRIFYISKNQKIQLFKTVCGEFTSAIKLTHKIQIDDNGKFSITPADN